MKVERYIVYFLLCLVLVGQTAYAQKINPLIPSKRNDRLLQEQAERQQHMQTRERSSRESSPVTSPAATTRPDQGVEVPVTEAATPQEEGTKIDTADYKPALLAPRLPGTETAVTTVEYQPGTGYYVLHTKIGDVDVATPVIMNSDEYGRYSEQQMMHKYWQQKISTVDHDNERKFDITDMKFNIGPADKVFGPGGVQLKLQGSAELMFAFNHQYVDNPSLTARSRNNNIFDFDEKIQVNVTGKVGSKLDFKLNYNTEASFAQDQQNLKLAYKGEEDDIIQSIEAGNVTMDLNSSLIQGTKALFGIKTNLQFGKLKVQALISQQNSESQTVSSSGGAQMTKFDIDISDYDQNKHFFLAYYFRDRYDDAMKTLPYVSSGVTINKIEVWVTNRKGTYDEARNIVAYVDLGEPERKHILNTQYWSPSGDGVLAPHNKGNNLYEAVKSVRNIQDISSEMSAMYPSMEGGEGYDKVESARRLNSSEYTLNAALGYISLKQALREDEVLAVAYEYTYGGQVYQVGEFSTDQSDLTSAPNCLVLKLLKSTTSSPVENGGENYIRRLGGDRYGTWDLMMKNIYWIGANTMGSDKFELYVQYRNDSVGTQVQYLPDGDCKGKQLIRVLGLDRLDSKHNPYPDGKFDWVEGYTVISSSGRIIFPVIEPFGSYLRDQIGADKDWIYNDYIFQELYDSTQVVAQEFSEKNKFRLTGKYSGTAGNEIRLNAMNIPRGSVKVTAGGATLVENVDYTVDYMMGTVTILNQSILESGTSVNVSLENQSTFSLKRKSLMGAHLEYQFNKDFMIGGTIMHLRERPLTTKVNSGEEPLANTIWGLNLNWKTEFQWLSNAIDKVPWMHAEAPSTLQVGAEFAHMIPGHTRDVGAEGTAYIDDFESTQTNIDVHYPNYWHLASTPKVFAESSLTNDIAYGKNRALLAWYLVDPIFGYPQSNTPQHIRNNPDAMSDHRTRIVYQTELFPNKQQLANEDSRMTILNLSYYPQERGPYNVVADELDANGQLTNPRQRWGGMMRKLDNTDFEQANIEYIEFWLMDPALTNPQNNGAYEADLYFNLGDISEDILKDGKKSFEHGLPVTPDVSNVTDTTIWGVVPKTTSTTIAFSNEAGARARQDVGLNGMSTAMELTHGVYKVYRDALLVPGRINSDVMQRWQDDPFSPINDPAGDNFHYYRGTDFDRAEMPVLERYKHYNGTEGNSPDTESQTESYGTASTLDPDIEDVNRDNTLNEYEKYFSYHVSLRPQDMHLGLQHITDVMQTDVTLRNGQTQQVTWYQFKIPLRGDSATVETVGSIRNFKSIRFMRVYMTGAEQETHLRFAELNLVRGDWRQYSKELYKNGLQSAPTSASFDVQSISIEENGAKTPVNYVLPPGVSRQTDPGQAQLIAQDEKSIVLKVDNLYPGDAKAIYKNTGYDFRNYRKLQMFVHAEAMQPDTRDLEDGDLSIFIRLGTDARYNYYEYEIPLKLTAPGVYSSDNENDRLRVWPAENMIDVPFETLSRAKVSRNKAKRAGTTGVGNTLPYVVYDDENGKPGNKITILGNPTIEDVSVIMIGVRNSGTHTTGGEVWVDELRLSQFNEEGGVAAMANVALGISDIAQFNASGRLETAGYGSIESNVLGRNKDNIYQLQLSAAMEVGRLFPEKAKLQIPAYVSYSTNVVSPKYDPLDTDVKLEESLASYTTQAEKDSVQAMANTVQTSTSFSVTNMKVNIKSKKKDMFYDPANFSISASYSKQQNSSPDIEKDITTEQKGAFNYQYSFNPKPWEPFKNVKTVQKVKFLSEMNFYYLPQSWAFNTNMHRTFNQMKMRDLTGDAQAMDLTFSKDFTWDRHFDFKYDLTKNMKFSLQTAHNASVYEGYYSSEIIKSEIADHVFANELYEAWRDTVRMNMGTWGKPYTFQQVFTANWNVPFNRVPYIEAISATGSYSANYNWNRTAASSSSNTQLGNTISSLQTWQVDGGINFETLYGKSKYWKDMTRFYTARQNNRRFKPKEYSETVTAKKGEPITINHRLGSDKLTVILTDTTGHKVPATFTIDGTTSIIVTPKADCEALVVAIQTRNPNERTAAEVTRDMFAYVGTMVRKLQVTYRETNSLSVPGFNPEPVFFGQQKYNDYMAPGLDFAFGFIPSDFITRAKEHGWLSGDTTVVQPAVRAHTADLDIKLTLEPLPGLKIQLNGKRYEASSTSIIYSYDQLQENTTGSFNITQVAIGTMFARIGSQADNYTSAPFEEFVRNIDIMQGRVQDRYQHVLYPSNGFMRGNPIANTLYDPTKGTVSRTSADVIIPAFFAAYAGRDVNNMGFNPFLGILNILPNWSVSYDGLGKLPWMRDHFRSVTLTHAYTCKYAIGSYGSYSTWVGAEGGDRTLGFVRDVSTDNPVPSGAYDIANVTLSEAFSPLIGVNMTMKNSFSLKAEYRKQRNLALNVTSVQLTEAHSDEFVLGGGYTIKNLNFTAKNKDGRQKKVSNDLKLNVDVSYKNIKSLLRKVDEGITQMSSGNKVWSLKLSADYVLSQKINLQFFYDHQSTTPFISTSYPVSADNVGINVKIMLTR